MNAIAKRLLSHCSLTWPAALAPLRRLLNKMSLCSQGVPLSQQTAPRPTAVGNFDLTGARIFLQDPSAHEELIEFLEQSAPECKIKMAPTRWVRLHALVRGMLRALSTLHELWWKHEPLTTADLQRYVNGVGTFADCWVAFQWRPTVWVHWVVCHSAFFMGQYHTLYTFSSLPSERKHQTFKRDVRHSFQGWRLSNPHLSCTALVHLLELDALDQGLRQHSAERPRKRPRLA